MAGFARHRSWIWAIAAVSAISAVWGCASTPREPALVAPRTLVAPYDAAGAEVLWAITPLRNETGVPRLDVEQITDKLIAEADRIHGVRTIPLNRVIQAMLALKMQGVNSPMEAQRLAETLGVDAIVVGSLTSYDPYTPALGMTLATYSISSQGVTSRVDPRSLTVRTTEGEPRAAVAGDAPTLVVSEIFDGRSHQTLMEVRTYAQGRVREPSALGWRRYVESMDQFTDFVSYAMLDRVLRREWVRLGAAGVVASGETPGSEGGR